MAKPSDYFRTILYTGNGVARDITTGIAQDLVWFKSRSNPGDDSHEIYDSVRGAEKYLSSNTTTEEGTLTGGLTSFNPTGFSLGSRNTVNRSGANMVAWCWKKDPAAGFDIVTYTGDGVAGRTVNHALAGLPELIFVKGRSNAGGSWCTYAEFASASPQSGQLYLEQTYQFDTGNTQWNNTKPTSNVFSLNSYSSTNANAYTYVAYLWRSIKGFSKFGKYIGNGDANGPRIYTDFLPGLIMVKRIDSTGNWHMLDITREPNNPVDVQLTANTSNSESGASGYDTDFLSNGWKIRNTYEYNASGGTYIYAAWAAQPFKYGRAH